jgi:hypothetical protein
MPEKTVVNPVGTLPMRWMHPDKLVPHPRNWRTHGEEQRAALRSSVDRHGWYKPLLWNERTGYLLNGHERREVAIERGDLLPVWVIDVPEGVEEAILLQLDHIGEMRVIDPLALCQLVEHVMETSGTLPAGYTADQLLELQQAAAELSSEDLLPGTLTVPQEVVVTLRYTETDHLELQGHLAALMERWGTEGVGQTVVAAIRRMAVIRLGESDCP